METLYNPMPSLLEEVVEFVLHLFINPDTPSSQRALRNTQEICEQHLKGHYELLVFDVKQHPEMAIQEQLLGIPTLIKKSPGLVRRLVGDLENRERALRALGIPATAPQ